jgi:hypothetical protein
MEIECSIERKERRSSPAPCALDRRIVCAVVAAGERTTAEFPQELQVGCFECLSTTSRCIGKP